MGKLSVSVCAVSFQKHYNQLFREVVLVLAGTGRAGRAVCGELDSTANMLP